MMRLLLLAGVTMGSLTCAQSPRPGLTGVDGSNKSNARRGGSLATITYHVKGLMKTKSGAT